MFPPLAAELPPDAEGLEGIEQLLGQVQTTMSQLRQIQVANQAWTLNCADTPLVDFS